MWERGGVWGGHGGYGGTEEDKRREEGSTGTQVGFIITFYIFSRVVDLVNPFYKYCVMHYSLQIAFRNQFLGGNSLNKTVSEKRYTYFQGRVT